MSGVPDEAAAMLDKKASSVIENNASWGGTSFSDDITQWSACYQRDTINVLLSLSPGVCAA